MKNYVKNEKDYEKIEIDLKGVKAAYDKQKKAKKHPTSVNLPEDVVADLKNLAQKKGMPYQTLMRMLIVEGLNRLKKEVA